MSRCCAARPGPTPPSASPVRSSRSATRSTRCPPCACASRPCFADPRRLKVGQNLKYDEWILGRHGLPLGGARFDTMLASYVLDPGRRSHGMDELATVFLGERTIHYDELFARGDRRKDILAVPLTRLAEYAAEDADVTLRLYQTLAPKLEEDGPRAPLPRPRDAAVGRPPAHGTERHQDRPGFPGRAERHLRRGTHLAREAHPRLRRRGLQRPELAATRPDPLREAEAQAPQEDRHRLEHRRLGPLAARRGTRAAPAHPRLPPGRQAPEHVRRDPAGAGPTAGTDLIHTSYSQAVAATGRLSCNDPNLQNIPIRTELGRQIRRAFIPRAPGHVFLSADYSQIELRLLAHLSGDAALRGAFRDGVDVHRRTAALIAGVPEPEVTADQRSRAKAINFGVIYGMGARALAKQIKVSPGGGQAVHRPLLRDLPRRAGVHRRDDGEGPAGRLRRDHAGTTPAAAGHPVAQSRTAQLPGTHRGQHADPGHRRGPDQAGDAAAGQRCCAKPARAR